MANYIHNGMSVTAVARQMGITRKTIYDRLHKYDLMLADDDDKPKLNPTSSDFAKSGGYDHKNFMNRFGHSKTFKKEL